MDNLKAFFSRIKIRDSANKLWTEFLNVVKKTDLRKINLAYINQHRTIFGAGAIALLLLIIFGLGGSDESALASYTAKRGEFLVSVTESGEIRAANSVTLQAPRTQYPQLQIVYMIPEGTTVKQGDVVVQFATKDVDKTIADKESELSMLLSDLARLKADQAASLADAEAQFQNAELQCKLSQLNMERMQFEAEIERKRAELQVEQNRIALEQAKRKIESRKIINKSELEKHLLKIEQVKNDIKKAKDDREKFTLRAPIPGLVVYEMNWQTNRKFNVGDSPWWGQGVVSLPDLSKVQTITQVNEVDVSKVKKGQRARVNLDAFPDKEFWGSVTSVATIGRTKDRTSTVKQFEVVVDIEGTDPILKPGMTTSNEVIMETIPDVVYVPIESVFEEKGNTIVYRVEGSSTKERVVKTGVKNTNYVVIVEGLKEGEAVALRNPKEKVEETLPKERPLQKPPIRTSGL